MNNFCPRCHIHYQVSGKSHLCAGETITIVTEYGYGEWVPCSLCEGHGCQACGLEETLELSEFEKKLQTLFTYAKIQGVSNTDPQSSFAIQQLVSVVKEIIDKREVTDAEPRTEG